MAHELAPGDMETKSPVSGLSRKGLTLSGTPKEKHGPTVGRAVILSLETRKRSSYESNK